MARFKDEDLACDEVLAHIDNEKLVTELAMNWRGQFSFVIDSKLVIKRLKFSDELKDKNDDIGRDEMAQRLDADFILLAGELSAFYDNVAAVMPLAKEDGHDC
ncbi:DNA recombination-dependent growth factor C [Photobacterium aphoticum]|uniref:Recombination-associated protein RdgC n=1 Tax=Photobacterium aphoticum TaxID=754436 RepID=A0A090RK63_9GAMM|nr:DNA recombination-dependent growth factor C [Photobacterium aphoticum]